MWYSFDMGRHNVVRGEKSSYGQANGSPGTEGYEGKHRETTKMDTKGTTYKVVSRNRIGGWVKKDK